MLRSRVVLLTNVGLEHTDVLGDTVEAIAAEKLAVVHTDDTIVVLPDDTLRRRSCPAGRIVIGGAREAAEAFVGHPIAAAVDVVLPGRLERRPGEVRDGAHNPDGVAWLCDAAPAAPTTRLRVDPRGQGRRRDAARGSPPLGDRFVATQSSNARSLTGRRARRARAAPLRARRGGRRSDRRLRRAHELGEPVLVTGSLYLLADLEAAGDAVTRRSRTRERITVLAFALVVLVGDRRYRVRRRVYPRQAPPLRP